MKNGRLGVAVLVAAFASISANAADVAVTLAPPDQVVPRGTKPRFVVLVKVTETTQSVMNFAERQDLRDNYARLMVTRNGAPVDVPVIISDPGPTRASDYVELHPGESLVFEHEGLPLILSELPVGTYAAVIKLQRDWSISGVVSNAVSFRVSEQ